MYAPRRRLCKDCGILPPFSLPMHHPLFPMHSPTIGTMPRTNKVCNSCWLSWSRHLHPCRYVSRAWFGWRFVLLCAKDWNHTLLLLQGFFNAILYFRGTFDTLIQDGKSLAFLRRLPLFGPFIEQRVAKRTAASLRRRGAAEGRPRNGGGTLNITSITDVPVVTLENTTVGNSEVGTAIEEDPMTPNHPPETITSMAVLTTTTKTTTPDSSSGEKNETERSATSHSLPETAPRTSSTITPSFAVVSHTPLDARAHTVGGRIEQDEESSCSSNECYNDEEGQQHSTN